MIDIVENIRRSSAASNLFFSMAREHFNPVAPDEIVRQWTPVTRTYCLNLAKYSALLAERADLAVEETEAALWESALLVPTHLFAEEMSQGNHGREGMHFHVFQRLGTAWPSRTDVSGGLALETQKLTHTIREQLGAPFAGAGCILVIETIAWDIVAAYREVLSQTHHIDTDTSYVDLHLDIEPGHAERACKLVELIGGFPGAREEIVAAVDEIVLQFGSFWTELARRVFAPGQIS